MSVIKIETGLKVYDIEDENGNIRGQISFNAADVNFIPRASKMQDNIQRYIEEVKSLADSKDTLSEIDIANAFNDIDNKIKSEIDLLFDSNASEVVFGNQSCLNSLNGVTFIERFLNAFMPIIKKEFEAEQKKSKKRIEKYTKQVVKW